jgi:ABC-type transport system involved in multi-copper enzyme maturation permease subunit
VSLLLTFFAAASIVDWGVETIGGFMVLLQIALVVLITPSLTSGLISTERESGGWELLRMTPMSPLKIISGKLLSVIWTVALILLATVPGYVVMIYIKPTMWLQVQNVLICLGFAALYTVSIGAFVGSLFRKTAAATTTCYAVLIVLFLGPLLIWMAQDAPFTHDFVEAALTINPTGAALGIIEFQLSESRSFRTYELLPTAWWVASIVSVGALCCFGFQVWRIGRPL